MDKAIHKTDILFVTDILIRASRHLPAHFKACLIGVKGTTPYVPRSKLLDAEKAIVKSVKALKHAHDRLKFIEKHGNYESDPTFALIDEALKEIAKFRGNNG